MEFMGIYMGFIGDTMRIYIMEFMGIYMGFIGDL